MIEDVKQLNCGKILTDIPLEKYTTYRIKGKAKLLVIPRDEENLIKLLKLIQQKQYPYKIIGAGSNLIFEQDYEGILIKLDDFNLLSIEDTKLVVGAGYNLMKLAMKVSRLGLTGMEFATGIPGTVGGAVFNNSGAYKSDMGYIVDSILVLTPELEKKRMTNAELAFHYRTSFLKENKDYICLEATIRLQQGDPNQILEIIQDRKKRRLKEQPLEYPSAGSVFRNPLNNYAGKLIEEVGFKGKQLGGAMVSLKHANFIINHKNATGKDIVNMIDMIKKEVFKKYDIELILEQEIVK